MERERERLRAKLKAKRRLDCINVLEGLEKGQGSLAGLPLEGVDDR